MIEIVFADFMGQDQAPWWGDPVVAGGFLLVGGVLGGLISWLSSRASDRRRAKREDRVRWHQDIRHVTAAVLGLANEYSGLNLENRSVRLRHSKASDKKKLEPEISRLRDARMATARQLELKRNELALIGSHAIAAACDDFVNALFEYSSAYRKPFATIEEHNAAARNVGDKRKDLISEVRRHLDLN